MELLYKINNIGLSFLKELFVDKKLDNDSYYKRRVENNIFLTEREKFIIEYMINSFDKNLTICEIGTGFGQILLALSILGAKTVGTEVREDRYKASIFLKNRFTEEGLDAEGFDPVFKRYPKYIPKADLLLSANIVATFNVQNMDDIIDSFKNFKYVIIDTLEFGKRRDSEEERLSLLRKIESFGFSHKDIGSNYCLLTLDAQHE